MPRQLTISEASEFETSELQPCGCRQLLQQRLAGGGGVDPFFLSRNPTTLNIEARHETGERLYQRIFGASGDMRHFLYLHDGTPHRRAFLFLLSNALRCAF